MVMMIMIVMVIMIMMRIMMMMIMMMIMMMMITTPGPPAHPLEVSGHAYDRQVPSVVGSARYKHIHLIMTSPEVGT